MRAVRLIVIFIVAILFVTGCSSVTKRPEKSTSDEAQSENIISIPDPSATSGYQPVVNFSDSSKGFTKEQRLSDAELIIQLFDKNYAPLKWKEEFFGFSYEKRANNLMKYVKKDITDADFYRAIGRFVSGFHDSHVSYSIPSNQRAWLPFDVDDIEGKIIVTKLLDHYADGSAPISVGDEVVSIDGRDAKDIRDELLQYVGQGNPRTEIRMATNYLTFRPQWRFPETPEGPALVVVKSPEGKHYKVSVKWQTKGYEMPSLHRPGVALASKAMMMLSEETSKPDFLEVARNRESEIINELRSYGRGYVSPFFSFGDDFVVRNEKPFYSGEFHLNDYRIGFLRIHTFSSSQIDFGEAYAELEEEVAYFEENTDALIIDVTGNTGGSYCFTLKVASMFFDEPQEEIQDQWLANRDTLLWIEDIVLNENEKKSDQYIAGKIANGIRRSMKKGKRLTESFPECSQKGKYGPYYDGGNNKISYTKPIVMLINEFAVSCGDYFPAFFKDAGRAVFFGQTTSGGGGTITKYKRLGYSEIKLSLTISMGVRDASIDLGDGLSTSYIENVGVSPDIFYDITYDDFMSGYKFYRQAVEETVLDLLE